MVPRYLNQSAVDAIKIRRVAQLVAGVICILIAAGSIVAGFLISGYPMELQTNALVAAAGILAFYTRKQEQTCLVAARQYAAIFSTAPNYIVTASELSMKLGKPEQEVVQELKRLFRKHLLIGCSLQWTQAPPGVILQYWTPQAAAGGGIGAGFVDVQCPGCNGATRLRIGSRGPCVFCGAPLEAIHPATNS